MCVVVMIAISIACFWMDGTHKRDVVTPVKSLTNCAPYIINEW
jgi:hypothetical protein